MQLYLSNKFTGLFCSVSASLQENLYSNFSEAPSTSHVLDFKDELELEQLNPSKSDIYQCTSLLRTPSFIWNSEFAPHKDQFGFEVGLL